LKAWKRYTFQEDLAFLGNGEKHDRARATAITPSKKGMAGATGNTKGFKMNEKAR
jgi:hypothetical protein